MNDIELRTNDPSAALRMTDIVKFADHVSYRCNLIVRSGGFACERPFYFDDSGFHDAVKLLRKMNEGEVGEALIKGAWETDFIGFKSDELGHVFVTGELTEHADTTQSLRFGFRTDQTVLGPLIRDFENLLKT